MVRALASDRPDQAFNISVLPGRAERDGLVPNTHRSDAILERDAKCSVIVADEIFRCPLPWKRFSDLACQPLGRRISGHRNPQQPPPAVAENKKCEKLLKGNRRDHKEINRRNPLRMIAKEGLPGLQWSILPRHHVDRNRGLGDIDAQFEQLAMDLGSAPEWVLKTHSSDQVAQFFAIRGRPRAGATSIAKKRKNPFDANAQSCRV